MDIVEVAGLTKRFGGLQALNDVSVSVAAGEIFGVVGPNGAGKSVFLNCLAGALRPDAGSVVLEGQETVSWSADRKCRFGLARTFQIPQPFPRLSAIENVRVATQFGRPRGADGTPLDDARRWLDFVEFGHPEDTLARNLNTVDLKRLDLARALGSRPRIVLLDELAAGLMTGQLAGLMRIIARIRDQGITVIMVEHVIQTITGLCDRVMVLHYGKKLLDGEPLSVMSDPRVVEVYLGQAVS